MNGYIVWVSDTPNLGDGEAVRFNGLTLEEMTELVRTATEQGYTCMIRGGVEHGEE